MVSVPYASLVVSSFVIAIACTTTCIVRMNQAPDITPDEAWGIKDFFSKNSRLPTPDSSQVPNAAAVSFPIPDQGTTSNSIFSASVALAYTFSLLNNSLVSANTNAISITNQLISDLTQSSSKHPNGTMYWPAVINISTNFFASSQNFLSGVVSGNSSDPASYSSENGNKNTQIQFLERTIGLDNVPVLMMLRREQSQQNDCHWVVCSGYNAPSLLISDPFVSSNANQMDAPKWVERATIYDKWSCENAGKTYYQLAVAVKKIRV